MSFFDRLSFLAGLWPMFLMVFLCFYGAFTLIQDFFALIFEPSDKEKARQKLFDYIKNGGTDKRRINRLAKKAGLKFGDGRFHELKSQTIRSGDIVLWGVQGLTTWQANQQKESLKDIFPKDCIIFPVWSGEGLLAILTPDKKPVSAVDKAIRREKLLAEPAQQW